MEPDETRPTLYLLPYRPVAPALFDAHRELWHRPPTGPMRALVRWWRYATCRECRLERWGR